MEDAWPTQRGNGFSNAHRVALLQRRISWAALIISCVIYVCGWVLGFDSFVRINAKYPAVVRSTLACAALSALALLVLSFKPSWHRLTVRCVAALVALICAFLVVPNLWATDALQLSGDRMSGGTAFAYFIFAVAITLALDNSRRVRQLALGLATFGTVASLLPLVAYVLDPNAIWEIKFLSAMSPMTAFILFLLFVALLLSFPGEGWIRTLLSDEPGGRNARRYIPIAVLGPVLLSYAGLHLTDAGLRYTGFHLGVITVITVCGAVAIILWTAGLENDRQASSDRENAQLRAIIDSFDSAAVFVLDAAGNLRMRNNRAQEMFRDQDQTGGWLLNDVFFALSDRRALAGTENPVMRLVEGTDDQDILAGWTGPDGTERALNFSCIRLPAETPQRSLIILSVEDQTESWLLRAALSDNQRSEAVGQLTWGVAHEMANIFGIVQISAESARLESISAKTGQNLDAILQACRRGTDLTHKLLEMTRDVESEPEILNVSSVLKTVSDLAAKVMPSFVEFDVQFPDRPSMLRCVRTDLESAVLNLLANARNAIAEAGHGRGRIELSVTEEDGMLEIAVADDGPGIPEELVERVRDPYFTTRESAGGRGIGLTLVDTFARRGGGTFRFMSPEQGGTRAVLRLPTSEEPVPSSKIERQSSATDLTGYRVLLVESDPPFRNTLTDGLLATGAEVATAASGRDALNWLASQPPPDVVITNFKLPDGVNGSELASQLADNSPESRVIFLSGSADAYARSDMPASDLVLGKPVQLAVLANAIELVPPLTQK